MQSIRQSRVEQPVMPDGGLAGRLSGEKLAYRRRHVEALPGLFEMQDASSVRKERRRDRRVGRENCHQTIAEILRLLEVVRLEEGQPPLIGFARVLRLQYLEA